MGQDCPEELKKVALHFMLTWVRSPLVTHTLDLRQVTQIEGYTPDALSWLIENEYIIRFHKGSGVSGGPGPTRKKTATVKEIERAKLALKKPNLKPSTIRYYQSILGIRHPKENFKVNSKAVPSMLESIYGLPNLINATGFASRTGLPSTVVKDWFRDLISCGRGRMVAVRGRRMIVTVGSSGQFNR